MSEPGYAVCLYAGFPRVVARHHLLPFFYLYDHLRTFFLPLPLPMFGLCSTYVLLVSCPCLAYGLPISQRPLEGH